MRVNLALYILHGFAIAFLLAMASFSKYAPTNHQLPLEHPPAIRHVSNPASYVRGTLYIARDGIRYALDGKDVSTYSVTGDKIFDFGETAFLVGGPAGDAFLGPNNDDRIRNIRHVSAKGETLWHTPAPGLFPRAAVSSDGTFFYADTSGLYAFSPEGRMQWHQQLLDKNLAVFNLEPWHFLVTGPNSTLYAGVISGPPNFASKLLAISRDGQLLWTLLPSPWAFGAPVFGEEAQIYAPSGNNLVLLDRTGKVVWKFTPPGSPMYGLYGKGMTPVVGKNGDLYVTAWSLYCVSPEGREKWRFHPDTEQEYFEIAPAIGPDGTLYLASSGPTGKIYAVTPDGRKKWVAEGSSTGYGLLPFQYTADGWMWRTEFQHVTGFPVEYRR